MMAYTGNYSRNNDDVTVSTYAPVSFINPDSPISKSRLGIGYFNSIMKLAIANRSNTEDPPKYDIDNQIIAYINFDNAYRLMCGIDAIIAGEIDNIVIPTNKALVKLSNGNEFNSSTPVMSITIIDEAGNQIENIYQFTDNFSYIYNMESKEVYSERHIDNYSLLQLRMVLEEYWKTSSAAIAASVRYHCRYWHDAAMNKLNAIADKTGAVSHSSGGMNGSSVGSNNWLSGKTSYSE